MGDKRPLVILTGHDQSARRPLRNVLVIDAGTVEPAASSESAMSRSGWQSCTAPALKRSRAVDLIQV